MSNGNQERLGREIRAKCAVRGRTLEKDGCALCLSISNVALVLDMDKNPIKSEMGKHGKRCDFAAYQRPNPRDKRAHVILMEFKAKLHNVNEALRQLGVSLEFLDRLSNFPDFAFDFHASALVCGEEIGPRKTRQLMGQEIICMGVSTRLRPLILVSGDKLADKHIEERGRPRPKAAKRSGKG